MFLSILHTVVYSNSRIIKIDIDRIHKWRSKKYSFVFVLIRPTSLVLKEYFFCILCVRTRLVSPISAKSKEYFFGRHLCIRTMNEWRRSEENSGVSSKECTENKSVLIANQNSLVLKNTKQRPAIGVHIDIRDELFM